MFGFLKPKDTPSAAPAAACPEPSGWLLRLKSGLTKTREKLGAQVAGLFGAGRKLDEAFYEELETVLLSADVGVTATTFLIDALRAQARRERYTEAAQLRQSWRTTSPQC